jgi:predicted  nucleic acid-binding Zn-ribbon protein
MKLLKLFNKRKREIERLNVVIDRLIERNEQLEKSVRVMKAERDLSQRELVVANKNILDLTNKVGYLKMQVDNAKDKNDSRYY